MLSLIQRLTASLLIAAFSNATPLGAQRPEEPTGRRNALEAELRQMASGGWLTELEEGIRLCDQYIAESTSSIAALRKAATRESRLLEGRLTVAATVVTVIKGELETNGRATVAGLVELWRAVERQDAAAFRELRPTVSKRLDATRQELEKHLADLRTLSALQPAFGDVSRAVLTRSRVLVTPLLFPETMARMVRMYTVDTFDFSYKTYLIAMATFLPE